MNNKNNLWVFGSLAVMAALIFILAKPWENKGIAADKSIHLYCASGLRNAMDEVAADYKKEYGVEVIVDSGPSGALLSRIRQVDGSLGDLFLPADSWYVDQLEEAGLAAERLQLGFFEAVIAVPKGNPKNIQTLEDLFADDVRVGLANPQAAIGRVSQSVLESQGLWERIHTLSKQNTSKITFMGKVTEVAHHIKEKTVDAGIIWKATAFQNGLEAIELDAFKENRRPLVVTVLKKTKEPTAALRFARYLTACDKGLPTLKKHHFQPFDQGDTWAELPVLKLMYGSMLTPGLRHALDEFKEREGVEIDEVANGCGILVTQMRNGLIPEAYVACDYTFMDQVQDLFEEQVSLSKNQLVMVVRKGNPRTLKNLSDLKQNKLRIGLGHSANSAMGALTKNMLEKMGIYEVISGRAETWEYDSGHLLVNTFLAPKTAALDVIIVYRSNVLSNPANLEKCEIIELNIPEANASQPYAIGKESQNKQLMQRFFDVVTSPENEERFTDAGFTWDHKN